MPFTAFHSLTLCPILCVLALAVGVTAAPADAVPVIIVNEPFDTDPVLCATPAPGVWYTDRYNPAGFESGSFMGDNRLKLSLAAADGQVNRSTSVSSAFYNTQGRKLDIPGAIRIAIYFFVDPAFETVPAGSAVSGGRRSMPFRRSRSIRSSNSRTACSSTGMARPSLWSATRPRLPSDPSRT